MKKVRKTKHNIITSISNQEAPNVSMPISHYTIGEFIPKGKKKAKEVHLLIFLKDNPVPFRMRFKSKDILGDFIVELDSARTRVFGWQEEKDDENTV